MIKENKNNIVFKKNGKRRRKRGRPTVGKNIPLKLIKTKAVLTDGSPSALARELNIAPATAHTHLQKPEIKQAVERARERALEKANINYERVFEKIGHNLNKKRGPDMRHAVDRSLLLLGEMDGDGEKNGNQRPIVNMPIILINSEPLKFDFLNND